MLGFQKSSRFVSDLVARLSISTPEAQSIGVDVNTDIFSAIKEHLRDIEAREDQETIGTDDAEVSALEKVGNFTVEKIVEPSTAGEHDAHLDTEAILAEIENPTTGVIRGKTIDPMIDHLLVNPVIMVEQKKGVAPIPIDTVSPTPQTVQPPKIDSYREPI